jgi:hypothetical protein
MKRLIFLKQEYLDIKKEKLNKEKASQAREVMFDESVIIFKEQMKVLLATKECKILKEFPPDSVLIEFADELQDKMYKAMVEASIVDIIDSAVPKNY